MARLQSNILTGDPGRAQTAAVGVLALLAGLQIFLLGRAIFTPATDAQTAPLPLEPPPPALLNPPMPGQLAGEPGAVAVGPVPGGLPNQLNPPLPGMLAGEVVSPPALAAPPPTPVTAAKDGAPPIDPEVAELLETVKEMRAAGETESVLELLRAAEGMDQNHPLVLHEIAQTYEIMGLSDHARAYWQRLEALGADAAGGLHATARKKLGRSDEVAVVPPPTAKPVFPLPEASTGTVQAAPGAALGIGPCQIVHDLTVTSGDRRVLRIPILRLGSEQIDPNAVNVDVFFYDLVNGSKVEPTRADPPMFNWMAMPVDWSGLGAEPLDVVYHLPRLSMEEQARHGLREYHGYVVKLYYQNRLQATASDPEDLLDLDPTPAEPTRSETAP